MHATQHQAERTAGAREPKANGAALPDEAAAALAPPKPKLSGFASANMAAAADPAVAPNAATGHADSAADVDVVDGAHWVPPVGCDRSALGDACGPAHQLGAVSTQCERSHEHISVPICMPQST